MEGDHLIINQSNIVDATRPVKKTKVEDDKRICDVSAILKLISQVELARNTSNSS